MPDRPLSVPARLCLLGWDAARPGSADAAGLRRLVRAGALAELARSGLLVDQDGVAVPAGPDDACGDAVLDGLLELVRESVPRRWRGWVRPYARVTFDAVREQLVADGFLRAERRRVLGVFPSVDHVVARPGVARSLREAVRDVLDGALPVAEVPERDAAVAALAGAAGLRTLGGGRTAPDRERRLDALTVRAGTGAPAARRALRELRAAVAAEPERPGVPTGG
ncbi:GPP34 family phosphoprotein [Streptomyces sp. SID8352]|uniref:GPP34 family phosphoprotein n=1 Tax=Streptomyces sp. SID8352 TaxID=2690338 RepID=UPI00136B8004|nr:GPP34 family phosphoprotein [Streptomyces sp. SID8352]